GMRMRCLCLHSSIQVSCWRRPGLHGGPQSAKGWPSGGTYERPNPEGAGRQLQLASSVPVSGSRVSVLFHNCQSPSHGPEALAERTALLRIRLYPEVRLWPRDSYNLKWLVEFHWFLFAANRHLPDKSAFNFVAHLNACAFGDDDGFVEFLRKGLHTCRRVHRVADNGVLNSLPGANSPDTTSAGSHSNSYTKTDFTGQS